MIIVSFYAPHYGQRIIKLSLQKYPLLIKSIKFKFSKKDILGGLTGITIGVIGSSYYLKSIDSDLFGLNYLSGLIVSGIGIIISTVTGVIIGSQIETNKETIKIHGKKEHYISNKEFLKDRMTYYYQE